ncbi:hypothetical protein [Saccharopolyspora hattusasensis]|uniref:hypothetical protein n=1 Tax=Saccharopolyspora hattusasensis TaxID=1128679 RepID=UPI003D97A74E
MIITQPTRHPGRAGEVPISREIGIPRAGEVSISREIGSTLNTRSTLLDAA